MCNCCAAVIVAGVAGIVAVPPAIVAVAALIVPVLAGIVTAVYVTLAGIADMVGGCRGWNGC